MVGSLIKRFLNTKNAGGLVDVQELVDVKGGQTHSLASLGVIEVMFGFQSFHQRHQLIHIGLGGCAAGGQLQGAFGLFRQFFAHIATHAFVQIV